LQKGGEKKKGRELGIESADMKAKKDTIVAKRQDGTRLLKISETRKKLGKEIGKQAFPYGRKRGTCEKNGKPQRKAEVPLITEKRGKATEDEKKGREQTARKRGPAMRATFEKSRGGGGIENRYRRDKLKGRGKSN